jgi:hypothetical protein
VKKLLLVLLFGFSVLFAANENIFSGIWCVENEDMQIEFIGKDSVRFSASDDDNISGSGRFSFNDTLLTAELTNGGMQIKIVYRHKKTDKGVQVITKSFSVNGDKLNANPDPINLKRCKK